MKKVTILMSMTLVFAGFIWSRSLFLKSVDFDPHESRSLEYLSDTKAGRSMLNTESVAEAIIERVSEPRPAPGCGGSCIHGRPIALERVRNARLK